MCEKSRIELLISKFENLQMEEHETIGQYHARISNISNGSFNLDVSRLSWVKRFLKESSYERC